MERIISIITGILAVVKTQLTATKTDEGIKETKEMLIGVNEISIVMINKFKDGVQFNDFTELYGELKDDAEFKAALNAAYDNFKAIPAELKDLDSVESIELAETQLEYLPKIIASIKKDA